MQEQSERGESERRFALRCFEVCVRFAAMDGRELRPWPVFEAPSAAFRPFAVDNCKRTFSVRLGWILPSKALAGIKMRINPMAH